MNEDRDRDRSSGHLEAVPDGCGCVELWELLSERRAGTDSPDAEDGGAATD